MVDPVERSADTAKCDWQRCAIEKAFLSLAMRLWMGNQAHAVAPPLKSNLDKWMQVSPAMPHGSSRTGSWPLFDPLRFVLASVVALGHFGVIHYESAGNLSVQVFFALSGWLIGGILLHTDRADLPRFYFNRVSRIWIPYLLAVLALYLVGAAKTGVSTDFFHFLFYDLTFTHNWFIEKTAPIIARMPLGGTGAHFWSLAVEEQFYLVAPVLVVILKWGRSPLAWLAVFVIQFMLPGGGWYGSVSLGVGAAALRYARGDWHETPIATVAILALTLASFALIVFHTLPYAYVAPVFAIALVLLCARRGARSGGLLTFMGGMSYPLYLNHWIGIFAAHLVEKKIGEFSPTATGIAGYVIAVAVGAITYSMVDLRVQKWRDVIYTPRLGQIAMALAYGTMATGILGTLLVVGRVR